ncbi:hypothetical protein HPP92_000524 [Vanilla planifolia]|uniref:Uncharacterized protein n=1 Tax=Vanilla planifolia TaxID=51239 RepID=A0A835VIU1_VANPL|nr:hypothetical protein HPP92_000524 [Vanilla planifolia]
MERTKRPGKSAPSLCLLQLVVLQSLVTTALCSQMLEQDTGLSNRKSYYTPTPNVPHPHPPPIASHSHPTTSHPSPPTPTQGGGGGAPPTPTDGDHTIPPFHPGTCSYWIAHPTKIVELIGYLGTLGDIFGGGCVLAFGGKNPTLRDALANTRKDSIGALVREGTAALLNSMACKGFPLSPGQVKSAFPAALRNDEAAAAQAQIFKLANEGRYGHKA